MAGKLEISDIKLFATDTASNKIRMILYTKDDTVWDTKDFSDVEQLARELLDDSDYYQSLLQGTYRK